MNKLLAFFILFISLFIVSEASHFRFGTISWQPIGTYNNIKFNSNFAYRITFFKEKSQIFIGDVISVGTLKYGFKTSNKDQTVSVKVTVTNINLAEDWFTGEYSVTKAYPTDTVPRDYVAIFTSCCRIGSLLNNANGDWNVTTALTIDPTQGSNQDSWNRSPVSGMVPIITLNRDKVNNFLVVANDPNSGDKLSYYLSTVYKMTQPPGIAIDQNTGMVTFTPTKVGLYSTQIQVKDNRGAYIVVDFLINSNIEPGVCHNSCSNPSAPCSGNSDCKGCTGSDSTGNTCTSNPPTWVIPPTPTNGQSIPFSPDVPGTFNLSCTTSDSSKTVSIQMANVPTGSKLLTNSQNKKTALLEYSWTPTLAQVGSYVVSATCEDNKGLTSTVTSFSLSVTKPVCGNGKPSTTKPGQCDCDAGWDPSKNCYECLPSNFGENCTPALPCENGVLNNGTQGDGVCTCYYGWEGESCNNTVSQRCNAQGNNALLSYTDTDPSYYNPTFAQVYLSTDATKAALTMPTKLSIPFPLPTLDILFVMDAQPATQNIWDSVANNMGEFINQVNVICEKTNYALGFFSDAVSGYPFQLSRVNGDNINVLKTLKYDSISSYSTGNSAEALSASVVYPSGWVKGSLKIVVLITDSDYIALPSTLTNNIIEQSVIPVVIGMNNDLTKWKSYFTAQGFGTARRASVTSATSNDWVTQSIASVKDVLKSATVKILSDPSGFATIASSSIALKSNTANDVAVPVTIKYPQGVAVDEFPVIVYSVIGYGTTRVIINYNHAPSASDSFINTKQNTNADFTLSGFDMDANTLTVKLSLPSASVGVIKIGSTAISATTYYPITTKFTFVPANNFYTSNNNNKFTFVTNDGCLDSAPATVSISIVFVNQAPSCTTDTIVEATALNTPINFQLKGSDIESGSTLKVVFGDISTIKSYGDIKFGNTDINSGSQVTLTSGSAVLTFTQKANIAVTKNFIATFKVNDGQLDSSSCSITFTIVHFNAAPIASAVTPLTIQQNGKLNITITGSDVDSPQVDFSLKSFTPGHTDAYFYDCDSEATKYTTAFNTGLKSLTAGKISYSKICYHAPLSNVNAKLVFSVLDNEGLESSQFTVNINVAGARENVPPVVTKIPNFTMKEDGVSEEKQIDGTDADPLDKDNLLAIILTQPKNGVLSITKTGSSAPISGSAPYKLFYRPNALFFGTDSFEYTVEDSLGVRAVKSESTTVTVEHVNHAPTLTIPDYSFTSQSSVMVLTLTPKDVDVQDTVFTCKVTTLPTQAIIKNEDGSKLSVGSTIVNNKYTITAESSQYVSFTDSFKASCADSSKADSNIATGSINYRYINIPPVSHSSNVTLDQDTQIDITVNATDTENQSTLKVFINALPTQGTLTTKSGAIVVSGNTVSYAIDDFVYTPNAGYSNWDKPNHKGPADSFNFIARDESGDSSSQATVSLFINPRNPPTYTGVTVLYTKENTDLPFSISGIVGNGGSNVFLQINSIVSNGSLHTTSCMGIEGCMPSVSPISTPYTAESIDGIYTFSFTPVDYENGDNYATIDFVLYDIFNGKVYESGVYRIIINVSPVNQPPEVILINYNISSLPGINNEFITNTVNMDVNTSVVITYDGKDIDSAKVNLTSHIFNPPLRGALYVFDSSAKGFLGSVITRDQSTVPVQSDGLWRIVFVPNKGSSGQGFGRIPITIQDDMGAISAPATVVINVNIKNIAPFINVQNKNYTALTNNKLSVTGLSFDDPDSVNNNVSIKVSLVGEKDETPISIDDATIALSQSTASCVASKTVAEITCISNKRFLNATISTVSVVHQTAGNYRVKLFVDDLGYNSPSAIRDISHLYATGYVLVTVVAPEVTTKENDNKTVLTGAIAGAAAGTALAAAGAWFFLKKKMPPVDTFFGDAPFADGGVSSNPLYQQSANSAVNPLYEGANTD